jgi:hypothetical protein
MSQENQPLTVPTQEPASPLPTFKILHRWTGRVLHEVAAETMRAAILALVANGVDLRSANLTRANLTRADLTRADLTDANLTGADLTRANLSEGNLEVAKKDVFRVLSQWPAEVPGLLAEVKAGRIDGSCYAGTRSCLKVTIAKVRHESVYEIPGLELDASEPAERWFMGMSPGHTPEISQVARITVSWIEEWMAANPQAAKEEPAAAVSP